MNQIKIDVPEGTEVDICNTFEKLHSEIADASHAALKHMQAEETRIFDFALRNNAVPPIKGEITKGKLRWRGIRMVNKFNFTFAERWLEQRGNRISTVIRIEQVIKHL